LFFISFVISLSSFIPIFLSPFSFTLYSNFRLFLSLSLPVCWAV
jgi:hypothetical protein